MKTDKWAQYKEGDISFIRKLLWKEIFSSCLVGSSEILPIICRKSTYIAPAAFIVLDLFS